MKSYVLLILFKMLIFFNPTTFCSSIQVSFVCHVLYSNGFGKYFCSWGLSHKHHTCMLEHQNELSQCVYVHYICEEILLYTKHISKLIFHPAVESLLACHWCSLKNISICYVTSIAFEAAWVFVYEHEIYVVACYSWMETFCHIDHRSTGNCLDNELTQHGSWH